MGSCVDGDDATARTGAIGSGDRLGAFGVCFFIITNGVRPDVNMLTALPLQDYKFTKWK